MFCSYSFYVCFSCYKCDIIQTISLINGFKNTATENVALIQLNPENSFLSNGALIFLTLETLFLLMLGQDSV